VARSFSFFSLVPTTQGAAAAVSEPIFFMEKFFSEKHIGSSFDVELNPGVMFEYFPMPLLKASRMGFELYPTVLLCAFIKVVPPLVRANLPPIRYRAMVVTQKDQ